MVLISAGRRRCLIVAAIAVVTATLTTAAAAASPRPAHPVTGPVARLVAQMTLDEKLSMLHGAPDPLGLGESGYVPGVPRLGIPALRLTDGGEGIRVLAPATALPAPVSLASAFDPALARQYGAVIGRDGRALDMDVLLGPTLNTIRQPYGGRNFETFSEDPLLTARTVAADVHGIQSQGLIATAKHFAENNQEINRDGVNVNVDEQTLHEIELRGFQAAVEAGAGSVMCSYNRVNGDPVCGNAELLNTVLRTQLGFTGWVMSDWGATHSTDAITKGLDQEMPDDIYFGAALKTAVLNGTIPMSAVDTAVTRILTQMQRFGLLNHNPPRRPTLDATGDADVARRVAEQGAVLLRNVGGALPLHGAQSRSVAVIGPTAKTPKVSGGGSARGNPAHADAPIDAIRARAGQRDTVTYTPGGDLFGQPIPSIAFDPQLATADGTVQLPLYTGYQGTITVPEDGDYRISASAGSDVIAELLVDDQAVFLGGYGLGDGEIPLHLTKGPHRIGIIPLLGPNPATIKVGWVTPAETRSLIAPAVAAAKRARTAVVFAYDDLSEGWERSSLLLSQYQNELITRVAQANPNTIVVLNTGSSIAMPWLNSVRSVLDMWYPGQEGASATAALLFGDASPGGRLSQTFPADEARTPVAGDPMRYPGVGNQENYSEGIEVGYRWYDAHRVVPLFPFGFGLTYTSFTYSDLAVRPTRHGVDVSFRVRNTGPRTGQAVPQVYLGPSPSVSEPEAVRALVGYQKVTLRPGQSRRVDVHVGPSELSYWNTATHTWSIGRGPRTVYVGPSSAQLPLRGIADVT